MSVNSLALSHLVSNIEKRGIRLRMASSVSPYTAFVVAFASLASPQAVYAQNNLANDKEADAKAINGYAEQLRSKNARAEVISNQLYAPVKKPVDEGQVPEIEMFVGESRVFPAPGVGRIAVGNGSILTAAALDGREVILFANGVGTSSLFIWNEDGRYQRVKINIVPGDTTRFAREIAAFLTTIPKAKASIIGDKVIVEGDDLNESDVTRIGLLAARYPQIVNFTNRLDFEPMVMIDVKVVEFPVTELRELGMKWGTVGGAAVGGVWGPRGRGNAGPYQINLRTGTDNAPPISDLGGTSVTLPSGLNIRSVLNLGLNGTLNALEQNGKTTILAEPQLSTRSGSKANFLAGGEFPYTVSTINGPTVQFKPYGVRLDIQPRVDRNGNIRSTIETEFSQIDTSVTSPAGPALLSRKTSTEFNVRSGETIVLSGLVQRENSSSIDKVPLLGDIPILGALFRSKKYQNKETELVIFVTPTVVDSRSPGLVDRINKTTDRLEERLGKPPYITDPLQPGSDPARPNLPPVQPASLPVGAISESTRAVNPVVAPAPIIVAQAAPAIPLSSVALVPVSFSNTKGSVLRVKLDGLVVRASPNAKSESLVQLGYGSVVALGDKDPQPPGQSLWRNVIVGEINGWATSQSLEPIEFSPTIKPYVKSTATNSGSTISTPLPPGAVKSLTLGAIPMDAVYTVIVKRLALRVTPDINAPIVQTLHEGQIVHGLKMEQRGVWTAIDAEGKRGWVATQWLQPIAQTSAIKSSEAKKN